MNAGQRAIVVAKATISKLELGSKHRGGEGAVFQIGKLSLSQARTAVALARAGKLFVPNNRKATWRRRVIEQSAKSLF
jgi:hypothetical protein